MLTRKTIIRLTKTDAA